MLPLARFQLPMLLLLAAAGTVILLSATENGIGVSPDSVGYISAARSLHDGDGLNAIGPEGKTIPLVHYPPLLPALLSLSPVLGLDPVDGVRWLNAVLFGIIILLVGVISGRCVRSCPWLAPAGSFLTLASVVMYRVYCMALSEPLFIFLVTLGLFLLARYTQRPFLGLLIGASVAVSLSFLTRYAGIAYVLAGILWLVMQARRNRLGRVRDAAVFAAICVAPAAIWMGRNVALAGSAVNRKPVFHPITVGFVSSAATALSRWTLPWVVILFILLTSATWRKATRANLAALGKNVESGPLKLFGLSILVYTAVLIASMSFVDRATTPDERILLPAYVSSLIVTVSLAGAAICTRQTMRFPRVLAVVLLAFLAGSFCVRTGRWIGEFRRDGRGYSARAWRGSSTIAAIRQLPPDALIFTNGADAVYILTGRICLQIPRKVEPVSGRANAWYEAQLQQMADRLRNENGVLVIFDRITRSYLPSREELIRRLPIVLLSRTGDGWIYGTGVGNR